MKPTTLTAPADPTPVCNCTNLFRQSGMSSVNHKNSCPVKQEAILRLHITPQNPCMLTG